MPRISRPARACSIEGCDDVHFGRGWCRKHYKRWRSHGDPLAVHRRTQADPECKITDCTKPYRAHGFCAVHYQRWKKHGDPAIVIVQERSPCSVTACDRQAASRKLCNAHLKRLQEQGSVLADVPIQKKRRGRTESCSEPDCDGPYCAQGLCSKHYMKQRAEALHRGKCVIEGCDRPRNNVKGYCVRHDQRRLKYGDPLAGGLERRLRGTGNRWQYDENRRAAKAKMSQVTGETAEYVKIIRNDPCSYCGAPGKHVDHIVPFSRGGSTHWTNLASACARCNYRKSTSDLLSFLLAQQKTPGASRSGDESGVLYSSASRTLPQFAEASQIADRYLAGRSRDLPGAGSSRNLSSRRAALADMITAGVSTIVPSSSVLTR